MNRTGSKGIADCRLPNANLKKLFWPSVFGLVFNWQLAIGNRQSPDPRQVHIPQLVVFCFGFSDDFYGVKFPEYRRWPDTMRFAFTNCGVINAHDVNWRELGKSGDWPSD